MVSSYWNLRYWVYWNVGTGLSDLWYCVSGFAVLNRHIIHSYSDPNVASVSIKYDDTLVSKSAEGAIEEIARAFDGMYDREKALIISAMRLAIKQVRAGLDTSYIPLPKAEIDPHMFLMTEALQHSGQKYAICFHK